MMVGRILGAAETVALGLLAVGSPAFAADTQPPVLSPAQGSGDPVSPFSDQAQQASHPLYSEAAQSVNGLRGTMMSAGILDPMGGAAVPGS